MTLLLMLKKAINKQLDEIIEYLPQLTAEVFLQDVLLDLEYNKKVHLVEGDITKIDMSLDDADLRVDRLLAEVIEEEEERIRDVRSKEWNGEWLVQ